MLGWMMNNMVQKLLMVEKFLTVFQLTKSWKEKIH